MAGKKIVKNTILALLLFFSVGLFAVGAAVYSAFTHTRMDSLPNLKPDMARYADLHCSHYDIASNERLRLAGYSYSAGSETFADAKGLVIVSHGLGLGGHIEYIDVIDFFARQGFVVFAYDATGCDNSDGDGIHSFTQGLKDLDAVIRFVTAQNEFSDLPLLLWGHSWGAFNSCAVAKYHPMIAGIASLSGYEKGMQPLAGNGFAGKLFYPYVWLFNRIVAGKMAGDTASGGLSAISAPVFIAHGAQDTFFPPETTFDVLYDKFKDDPRFTFMKIDGKKHLNIYSDNAVAEYRNRFENGMDFSGYDKIEGDKFYGADSDLMRRIAAFYDKCIASKRA